MTRINLVEPGELCDQHLFAEWRELTRIPNSILSGRLYLDNIPTKYTVRTNDNPAGGKGHVKFFINKRIKTIKPTKVKKPYKKLTKEQYAEALQHPKWQKKRLKIFERDNWKCRDCGDTETTLHIHHLEYTKKYPWNEPSKNLITVCTNCYKKRHKINY